MQQDRTLLQTAKYLVDELFRVKPGETFVITADEYNSPDVIDSVGVAAVSAGAKVLKIWMPAPGGVGMAADNGIASKALAAALAEADIWAEFNKEWIYGGNTYITVMNKNTKLRHMNLTGASIDLINSCIGKINYDVLRTFGMGLADMIRNATNIRMTSELGTDISCNNVKGRPILCELGEAYLPGTHMLPGQIAWTPDENSVNGVIAFDGALAPVCGIPSAPVFARIENGTVQAFWGCEEAEKYYSWLKSFHDPQMFRISHCGLGVNPGAVLSGDILADQRVWGSATWAFGSVGANLIPPNGIWGASHSDCVCLRISLYIDGVQIYDKGELVHHELAALAAGLMK